MEFRGNTVYDSMPPSGMARMDIKYKDRPALDRLAGKTREGILNDVAVFLDGEPI